MPLLIKQSSFIAHSMLTIVSYTVLTLQHFPCCA
jgi:hypothetical protein